MTRLTINKLILLVAVSGLVTIFTLSSDQMAYASLGDYVVSNLCCQGKLVTVAPDGTQTLIVQGLRPFMNAIGAVDVDFNGDFIATGQTSIIRITPSGTVTLISTGGFLGGNGVQIDLAGDFIISDFTSDEIVRLQRDGTQTSIVQSSTLLDGISGLQIDSNGDYIAVTQFGNSVVRITPSGVITEVTQGGNLATPANVAIDSNGDYIVTSCANNKIVKVTPSGVQSVITSGNLLSCPFGVIVDTNGDLIVNSRNPLGLIRIPPDGTSQTLFASGNHLAGSNVLGAMTNEVPAQITVFSPVDIDIKPSSDPNSINTKSGGAIPIAILGSDTFDVTDVDVTILAFALNGATPKHDLTDPVVYASHLEDVNGDGFTDLVSHYVQKETGLLSSDTDACITGQTTGGTVIGGCDSVKVK